MAASFIGSASGTSHSLGPNAATIGDEASGVQTTLIVWQPIET